MLMVIVPLYQRVNKTWEHNRLEFNHRLSTCIFKWVWSNVLWARVHLLNKLIYNSSFVHVLINVRVPCVSQGFVICPVQVMVSGRRQAGGSRAALRLHRRGREESLLGYWAFTLQSELRIATNHVRGHCFFPWICPYPYPLAEKSACQHSRKRIWGREGMCAAMSKTKRYIVILYMSSQSSLLLDFLQFL